MEEDLKNEHIALCFDFSSNIVPKKEMFNFYSQFVINFCLLFEFE